MCEQIKKTRFGLLRSPGSIFLIGISWIGSDIIIRTNQLGYIMDISVGFTLVARVPTIIGFIFLKQDGCGRTALLFLIFFLLTIPNGTSTTY